MPAGHYDAAILGAGAAGLMAAFTAARRGKKIVLLEHTAAPGGKILISGGGRCNFTNTGAAPARYYSANPSFCISALRRYTPEDFIALVRSHAIPFHEKKLGQLFCDRSARDIVAMLMAECNAANVELRCGAPVTAITKPDHFVLQTAAGPVTAASLVIATGGLSIPKMGATGFAYAIARQFGLPLVETRPALVPLTFDGALAAMMQSLSGVAVPARVTCGKSAFDENILFTHRGLSGPAILQISSLWREGASIAVNLMPGCDVVERLRAARARRPNAALKTILAETLPQRLAQQLGLHHGCADTPMQNLRDQDLRALAGQLQSWQITPAGSEGYAKAEVTLGGIDTRALSSQTMMASQVPGLYCIGESVDVTGWLGGYNFQWAWASGWCAGQSL